MLKHTPLLKGRVCKRLTACGLTMQVGPQAPKWREENWFPPRTHQDTCTCTYTHTYKHTKRKELVREKQFIKVTLESNFLAKYVFVNEYPTTHTLF